MSAVDAPLEREPVEIEARRSMTYGEKLRRWEECGCACMICKRPCPPAGPEVIWDHRIPLALGGTNDLANMEPNHVGECAAKKTAKDRRDIAKALRNERQANPETRRQSPHRLRSRGFQKDPLR